MIPSSFEYYSPTSLEDALSLLSTHVEDAKLLAGGQSLLPLMKLRLAKPKVVIDLSRIQELNYIRSEGNKIVIGALATYSQREGSDLLQTRCPLLSETASVIADVQIRNQGTIGGGLAHADPASDMPAAVLALEGELKVVGPKGERWIRAEEFFITMLTTALSPDEILTEIRIPVLKGTKTAYLKAAQRASGFAVVGIAVCLRSSPDGSCEDIAIGVTGVTDKAYRAEYTEKMLKGKKLDPRIIEEAAVEVTHGLDVMEDINASPEYRSHLARVYLTRAVQTARERQDIG
ncbi:MAG: xanthine dehydrogenase family protein subunit M [Deltaproteobacteria bacterium]|nr:xanthine dehydrogenase family protein subunit M [Deltaproteobacteria bacterium]